MAKLNFNLVKHFFSEVMDLPQAEHESWLLEHCPDSEVRKEVLSLLKYHGKPAAVDRPALRLQTAGLPERIDKYRVLSRLGEGGMGSVFLAERDDGLFNQKVALKVIRNKHVAGSLLKRFQLERQILASLNHPNISRLLDGGVTGQGQQFLVLEYVKGLHINDYCDRNRLTIHERLQLFKILCQTLHYAHHKFSLIHRDLKPGNILVDQDGVPKLLDFGIAKVLRREEIAWSQSLVLTPFGERQLTPLFASPEQIQGFELTIQSDIYSLGVILYELLCGRNPHRLHQVPIHRVAQVFCQEIPEAMHIALQRRDGDEVKSPQEVAYCRRETITTLTEGLRGEIARIVFRALKKMPGERYSSALEFAETIQNYLDTLTLGQPHFKPAGFQKVVEITLTNQNELFSLTGGKAPHSLRCEAKVSESGVGLFLPQRVVSALRLTLQDQWEIEVTPGQFALVSVTEPVQITFEGRNWVESAFVWGEEIQIGTGLLRKLGRY